jgi:hypothetical protein
MTTGLAYCATTLLATVERNRHVVFAVYLHRISARGIETMNCTRGEVHDNAHRNRLGLFFTP